MQHEHQFKTENLGDASINLREEIEKYVYYWKWFVAGIVISIGLAFLYLRYTTNLYEVSTTILIDDKDYGRLTSELSAFEDLGLLGNNKTNLDNEMELLKSRSLIERVVKDLNLNVTYFDEGRLKNTELFQEKVPIKLNIFSSDTVFYNVNTVFLIAIKSKTNFVLKNVEGNEIGTHVFGENIHTEFGDFTITPTALNANMVGKEITIRISRLQNVIDRYRRQIQIRLVNSYSSVILLKLKDPVKAKAQVILDNLVAQYNNDAVEDKSVIAKSTDTFINDRLKIITEDLYDVDKGVEDFKTKNKLTDISSEASFISQTNASIEEKIMDLNTQINLVNYMSDYVLANIEGLIPANLGLKDASVSQNTLKYNELLLERNRIFKSSSALNPIIINLDAQISQLRKSISQSLENFKSVLTISLNDVMRQEVRLNSKITSVPKQEREFRDIQRQQQIIESLYLYLLQKREENAISLAVTLPNAKIIDKAYGSNSPVSPNRKMVYVAAVLLGFIAPFGVIYLLFLLDNKVHTRKDVELVVKAPMLGDIPNSKSENKIVVSELDRSSIAESFRLLRTNINFMLSSVKEASKSIFITSTLSGEGKTFIAINLASVFALSSKKVLLVGADIRNPKISEYLKLKGSKGLTHFLMDDTIKVTDVVESVAEYGFDMINSGAVPPNPSELLMNGRFSEVMAYGKKHYDYVIVDTSPVNLVTDTLLISDYSDLFMYVIRADYMDKRMLEIPKIMYEEKRLPNMALLVNDTNYEKVYGYGYGYAYGYGYHNDTQKKIWSTKSWFKKTNG